MTQEQYYVHLSLNVGIGDNSPSDSLRDSKTERAWFCSICSTQLSGKRINLVGRSNLPLPQGCPEPDRYLALGINNFD
jgi:hypothetical protein